MKILYIHQYFKTPDIPGGTRSYWNSLELIKNGHEVIVIRYDKTIKGKRKREKIDGIDIISLNIYYSQYMGILARVQSFVSFMFAATRESLKLNGIDLVIATSTPLTVGYPALRMKFQKKVPFIFEVRDLWPEVPIQMGGLRNPLLIYLARWFERRIYKKASHVIALSPGMKNGVVSAGVPDKKVTMIPNMAKIDRFFSRPPNVNIAEQFNIPMDQFKVIYFGALGEANAIEYIMDAAHFLVNENVALIFIGYGPKTPLIESVIADNKWDHVHYLGVHNMEITSELVNLCDISLVTFSDIPILATNSPNKLFDSLSAGKPIIVNSPGWTKELVENYDCGVYVSPSQPQDLADKILHLKANPNIRKIMGDNARRLAESKYDKSILCKQFVDVVHNSISQ